MALSAGYRAEPGNAGAGSGGKKGPEGGFGVVVGGSEDHEVVVGAVGSGEGVVVDGESAVAGMMDAFAAVRSVADGVVFP